MIYAIYNIETGRITRSLSMPEFLVDSVVLEDGEAIVETPRTADDVTECIVDGVLAPHTPPPPPIELLQAQAWENIKERRLQAVTSGVYVESVDKWFHTDEVSVTSYSTIAGMIALDNYEPVQWKVMDNTWLILTESLFKEVQTAMSVKTNLNYVVAEHHKAAMLEATNPLEYDYSKGWV